MPDAIQTTAQPDYVQVQPDTCHLQPFLCQDAQMYGFFLEGNQTALQALVDQRLNTPRGADAMQYRVCVPPNSKIPLVMLTFTLVARGSSTQLPDSDMGYIPETSCTFWVLLSRMVRRSGPLEIAYTCFAPFIIADNCFSVCAGREIYGFPKQQGAFGAWPPAVNGGMDPAPDSLNVNADALFGYNPGNAAMRQNLVRIVKQPGGSIQKPPPVNFSDILNFWGATGTEGWSGMDLVFLKQFRDAANGKKACYQAVIEAPMTLTSEVSLQALSAQYRIAITHLESHRLAQQMGFTGDEEPLHLGLLVTPVSFLGCDGFCASFSWISGNGTVVWSAGS